MALLDLTNSAMIARTPDKHADWPIRLRRNLSMIARDAGYSKSELERGFNPYEEIRKKKGVKANAD